MHTIGLDTTNGPNYTFRDFNFRVLLGVCIPLQDTDWGYMHCMDNHSAVTVLGVPIHKTHDDIQLLLLGLQTRGREVRVDDGA